MFLFLVTPAYADQCLQKHNGIQFLIENIWKQVEDGGAGAMKKAHSVVAVVDKIPRPYIMWGGTLPTADATDGFEGVAFAHLDSSGLHVNEGPGIESTEATASGSTRPNGPASLTFNINSTSSRVYSVEVPLANTIFRNGLTSTLIHNTFAVTTSSDGKMAWHKLATSQPNQLTVDMSLVPGGELLALPDSDMHLTLPIIPLTSAREVVGSMGNIIRTLRRGASRSSTSNLLPASQELEAAVQNYFKARSMAPEPVSVWALIVPKATMKRIADHVPTPETERQTSLDLFTLSSEQLEQLWKTRSPGWPSGRLVEPLTLLQEGVRFCKVTSGGGGWGKKAGLLSLEPDVAYVTKPESQEDQEGEIDSFSAMLNKHLSKHDEDFGQQIIETGDGVQFFIAPDSFTDYSSDEGGKEPQPHPKLFCYPHQGSLNFGVASSTMDQLPGEPGEQSEQPFLGRDRYRRYWRHFGALSEKGFALKITKQWKATKEPKEIMNQWNTDTEIEKFSRQRNTTPESEEITHTRLNITRSSLQFKFRNSKDPGWVRPLHDADVDARISREETQRPSNGINLTPTGRKEAPHSSRSLSDNTAASTLRERVDWYDNPNGARKSVTPPQLPHAMSKSNMPDISSVKPGQANSLFARRKRRFDHSGFSDLPCVESDTENRSTSTITQPPTTSHRHTTRSQKSATVVTRKPFRMGSRDEDGRPNFIIRRVRMGPDVPLIRKLDSDPRDEDASSQDSEGRELWEQIQLEISEGLGASFDEIHEDLSFPRPLASKQSGELVVKPDLVEKVVRKWADDAEVDVEEMGEEGMERVWDSEHGTCAKYLEYQMVIGKKVLEKRLADRFATWCSTWREEAERKRTLRIQRKVARKSKGSWDHGNKSPKKDSRYSFRIVTG